MSVSKEQVLATAALARIDLAASPGEDAPLTPQQAEEHANRLASQLDAVVRYMDILNQVDTTGVEPLYSPMLHVAPPREDRAEQLRSTDEILANAPKKHSTFFAVPPVI